MTPAFAAAFLCGTQAPSLEMVRPVYREALPPGEPLLERDWSSIPNHASFEHFALHWGSGLSLGEGRQARIGDALEAAWENQVDRLGWEQPPGTQVYKVDVFMGNSGDGAPQIDFVGAYVTGDANGEPYIVVHPDVGNDVDGLLAHEFNHTVQFGNGPLYSGVRGSFYYEATANWMAAENTGDPDEFRQWGPYLLSPELSVHTFSSIGADPTVRGRALRQYAAAMFVQHVVDQHGADLIRRSWDDPVDVAGPLAWFDAELPEGVANLFVDFAVSHATGDNPYAELYREGADSYVYDRGRDSVLAFIPGEGGAAEVTGPDRPEGFAWNHLVWRAPSAATATFSFTAGPGGRGSAPGFQTVAVIENQGERRRVPFEDSVELDVVDGDFVHFVVVSVPRLYENDERFGYTWSLDVEPTPEARGCGCRSTSGFGAGLWGLPALLWLRRRAS